VSALQPKYGANEEEEKAEENYRSPESEVDEGNETFGIVGNDTPSSDEDIANRYRMQSEDTVADAVNEADGYAVSKTEYRVVDQRQQSSRSIFCESQELLGADFEDDLKSVEHSTPYQGDDSDPKHDTVPTSI
jgi:hypothetical protein